MIILFILIKVVLRSYQSASTELCLRLFYQLCK